MAFEIVAVNPLDPADDARCAAWQAVAEAAARVEYGEGHSVWSVHEFRAIFRHDRYERHLAFAALDTGATNTGAVGNGATNTGATNTGATDTGATDIGAVGNGAVGAVVGHLEMRLGVTDNTHRLDVELAVHPEHRRRGIGSALLDHVERVARAEHLTVLGAESDIALGHADAAAATAGFAARHGYTAAQVELRSRLDLPADLAAAHAQAAAAIAEAAKHADGYEVITYTDDVPEQWLTDRALLSQRMSTDAPLGEVDYAEERWDADRVRDTVALARAQRRRMVETVARHQASGRLVGFTTLYVAEHEPEQAYQWDTIVLDEHRGHRLGLLLKATNLAALLDELPGVRRVHTWNAEENEPMLRVNRALGFAPIGRATEWQRTIT